MEKKISTVATIQIDLDGLWTNLKYYGHTAEISPDLIFTSGLRRYLDLLDEFNIKATFFVIGKDIEVPEKKALLREAHQRGHELANHTFSHPFGFRKLSLLEKIQEIENGEKIIEKITGKKPVGFKVPGYDLDSDTLQLLASRGYLYDSSLIATPVYPIIMRLNHLVSGGIKRTHGPKLKWFFAPNNPYFPSNKKEWRKGNLSIQELPCSVMPLFRLPYHATFATKLGFNYFKLAHSLAKFNHAPLNYEFHALDLCDDLSDKRLSSLTSTKFEKRYSICKNIIKNLAENHEILTSKELVKTIQKKHE